MPSVHLAHLLPKASEHGPDDALRREEWSLLMRLRDDALAQLDKLTRQIGKYKALDAEIIYEVSDADLRRRLEAHGVDMEDMAGAGCHSFVAAPDGKSGVTVKLLDRREAHASCARCWKRRPDVGGDAEYADLCQRCVAAVRASSSRNVGE